MNIKISPRLEAIAGCIAGVKTMADIGTDHGYLPVFLVENHMVSTAIASDTNQQPLKKAEKIISEQQLESYIETRLGSGLSVLKPGEVEAIVMAGMGGLLIRDLLDAEPLVAQGVKKLVLQPMNNQAVLRRYLETHGFKIISQQQLESYIETRLGSGLSVLKPGEVEAVVMAGMGGLLIRDLLEAEPLVAQDVKKLVLQPMNNQAVLRRYLETHGFKIIKEDLAQEMDRVYEIMVVAPGEMIMTNPLEYELGFEFDKNKHRLLETLINRKIGLEQKILISTEGKATPVAKKQFEESRIFIQKLNEVKKCL